ncbi:MAG: SDR family NAD(P)-dependent oxidoreductase [Bacteroidota bacterium]
MMTENNKNTYTLITGASSGIGMALARECASRGMNLYLVSLPGTGLPELASELSDACGIQTEFLETDLEAEQSHAEVYRYSQERQLRINMLINNVGVGYNGDFEKMEEAHITRMMMLNMKTTTLLTQLALPELKSHHRAYILNLCSMAAFIPIPGKSIYSATKAYVLYFTKSLQSELKATGIQVSCVVPAGVPTNSNVIDRIKHTSWFGKKLIQSPETVARHALTGLFAGKTVIFPGNKLKALYLAGSILPQGLVNRLMTKEFRK